MMFFIGGAILGLALATLLVPFLPSRPKLSAALDRMGTTSAASTEQDRSFETRIGSWLIQRMPAGKSFVIPEKDLALVGMTKTKFVFTKAAWATGLLVLGILAGVYAQMLNLVPFVLPAAAAVGLGILGWFVPDSMLKTQAAAARVEFVRCTGVFLHLVATERRSGRPPGLAMEHAASVGRAWPFRRMLQALNRARYDHSQPWDALAKLAEETDIPELNDAAKLIALSGTEGASVYEALRGAGRTIDSKLRNEERAKGDDATRKVGLYTAIVAILFTGVIMTPLILSVI